VSGVLIRLLRHPLTWLTLGAVVAAGLYWFQPWRLFTTTVVTETLAVPAPSAGPTTPSAAGSAAPDGPAVVRQGAFVTHEHDTAGTARLVRNPDGSHQVELVGLATSDGPDLRVWLTDQPVRPGRAGWHVFDDGRYVELGRLKGNRGDQVYRLAAGTDPAAFRSVSIWCKRFAVSFGAADLA
jgi:hypothetical protein